MREKLIELLAEHCAFKEKRCVGCDEGKYYRPECKTNLFGKIADHLIANGVTVQEWISVKDRLPTREDANETESILAINKDEKYVGRWVWDIVARWPAEFTYWMPLPEPPKEVE